MYIRIHTRARNYRIKNVCRLTARSPLYTIGHSDFTIIRSQNNPVRFPTDGF